MGKLSGWGVMVALDVSVSKAISVVDAVNDAEGNYSFKVGRPLEMEQSIDVIKILKEHTDLPIIYDGKIADIPYISSEIAELAYSAGADGVIVHSFCGSDSLSAIKGLLMGDVIAVVHMSHPGSVEFYSPHTIEMIEMAERVGVDGIVFPATHPERAEELRKKFSGYVLSPGVGTQGAEPGSAVGWGADWEIVGRSICTSKDVRTAAESHFSAVDKAHKERHR